MVKNRVLMESNAAIREMKHRIREAIFSEEIVWEPVEQTDPTYHQTKIREALRLAASKMPRVPVSATGPAQMLRLVALPWRA